MEVRRLGLNARASCKPVRRQTPARPCGARRSPCRSRRRGTQANADVAGFVPSRSGSGARFSAGIRRVDAWPFYYVIEMWSSVFCVTAIFDADVSVGSKGDLTAPKSNFRSTPESGLKSDITPGPVRANRTSFSAEPNLGNVLCSINFAPPLNQFWLAPESKNGLSKICSQLHNGLTAFKKYCSGVWQTTILGPSLTFERCNAQEFLNVFSRQLLSAE